MATRRRKKSPGVKATSGPPITASGEPPVAADAALDSFLGGRVASVGSGPSRPGRKAGADPWGEVIETVFDLDPVELVDRLTKELRLGGFLSDYGRIKQAVDDASGNYYDARRLERAAKLEEENFIEENSVRMELLRTAARDDLTSQKVKGTGAITKQQIEDKMIASWSDEVSSYRKRKRQLHATARTLEGLAEAWNHRNSQLKAMLERAALGRPRSGG